MPETSPPSFVEWSSFPFEGELRVKKLDDSVAVEPPRKGEDKTNCAKCQTPDDAYIWVNENWRVRSMDRPTGLPMVLILESRSHLDLGDLPNMLAAELGVMTVRLERAIRSLDGVARVHVNRWGDGAAHLHLWFMARPYGRLQLRGTFLTLWDEILPPIPENQWRENLALVAAWLAEFGGEPLAKPPRIDWKAPSSFAQLIQTIDITDSLLPQSDAHADPDTDSAPESAPGPDADSPSGVGAPSRAEPAPPESRSAPVPGPAPAARPAPEPEPSPLPGQAPAARPAPEPEPAAGPAPAPEPAAELEPEQPGTKPETATADRA